MGVIMHNNILYGGGSSIEPNPQESATDQLETLGIDGDVYEVTDANAIHTSDVGVANGIAELDANGFVPSSQLPSYVDDVLEYASRSAFPVTGETGKIYIALDTNLTYRWGGSDYVEISPSLALGETSSTAYRGDRGKIAYDHSQSDHSGIKPAFTEASTRANIASGESFATLLGKIKKWFTDLKDLAFIGKDGTSSTKYLRGDGTWQNFPTIPTVNNGTLTIQKNGTNVQTFSANQSANATANIECATPSDVEGSKVVTGNPITITDAAGIKAEKIEIGFEPKQAGSGTPSPSNIRPITGYTSLSADRCGKNLWGGGQMKFDILYKIATATSPSTNEVSFYPNSAVQTVRVLEGVEGKPFKENTQYTFIVKSKNTSVVSYAGQQIITTNLGFFYTDGTNEIIYHIGNSANTYYTSAIKSNASKTLSYIRVIYQSGDCTFDVTNCGIFEGNVATSAFEAYNGRNVTVQFGQTLYGGKLTILQDGSADVDVDTGFDVYDGSSDESWTRVQQTSASAFLISGYASNAISYTDRTQKPDIQSNYLSALEESATWGSNNGFITTNINLTDGLFYVGIQSITTVEAWRTYLASKNLQVTYKLKNPFTLHLSPVETLTLLQGINNVWTDGNTLSLTYQPDNAIGQAKGTAQEAMAIANGLKPLYSTGSVGSGKTGSQIIAEITLPEAGTYYITGWARFTGNGKKAVWLWCEGSLSESWEDSTITAGEPKTFSTFAIYTASAAEKVVQVDSYTVSASNAVTGGLVAFKIA